MTRVFNINPTDMSDGSGRLYSIDTPIGERIASTASEAAARQLRDMLNDTIAAWVAMDPTDRVPA